MDSSTITALGNFPFTHIAAVMVGILVMYFFVGGASFQKKSDRETADVPTNSSKNAKKKAKRKKSKASSPSQEDEKVVAESPAPATASGSKTKKKKKKKKSPAAASASSSSKAIAEDNENKPKNSTKSTTDNTRADATPNPPVPQKETQQRHEPQQPRVEQEEWTTIGETKKDRKKKRPAVAAATSSSDPKSATTAAPSTETVTVDARRIGVIIGPKGATLRGLEDATGCKLDVSAPSKDDDDATNRGAAAATTASVTVTADRKESLVAATRAVRELAAKGYAAVLQSEDFGENSVSVHPRYLNEIVGPSGRTIRALQTTLNVKITIPPTDWKPDTVQVGQVQMAKVGIAGSKESIVRCKQAIRALTRYRHADITHPGTIHREVSVPTEFFHCIIGPRGSEIRHIKGNYKVQVHMPDEESFSDDVLVVGEPSNVERAVSHIHALMDRDTRRRESKYNDEHF